MKKDGLKDLLEKLDAQYADYNAHLTEANKLFDRAMKKMEWFISHDKKDLQLTLRQIKKVLRLMKQSPRHIKKRNTRSGK
jgi:hypothetical protein